MGKNIDKTFIQSKMLNVSKGPADHSLRTQADKAAYSTAMREVLENQENLEIRQAEVTDLLTAKDLKELGIGEEQEDEQRIAGVRVHTGTVYLCKAVIICTGTYLNARCLVGESITETGPSGMQRSTFLRDSLEKLGILCAGLRPERRPGWMEGRSITRK